MEKGVLWKKRQETAVDAWLDLGKLALIAWVMFVRDLPITDALPTVLKVLATINRNFMTTLITFLSFRIILEVTKRVWKETE